MNAAQKAGFFTEVNTRTAPLPPDLTRAGFLTALPMCLRTLFPQLTATMAGILLHSLQNQKYLRSLPLLIYIPWFWWDQHPPCISQSPEETTQPLVPSRVISPLTTSSVHCCVPAVPGAGEAEEFQMLDPLSFRAARPREAAKGSAFGRQRLKQDFSLEESLQTFNPDHFPPN